MGKNKKSKPVYNDLALDSKEELDFIYWLEEAMEHGLVSKYLYQPCEYVLFDKEDGLLKAHIYTPDFAVYFTSKFQELYKVHIWHKIFKRIDINKYNIIDIKGMFNQNGGDRVFAINQKWVYQKYKVYVHKIVPEKLFAATWCPEKCRYTPIKKQIIEKYKNLKNINEIVKMSCIRDK